MDELTPTQRRMVELLADGKPHERRELHALLPFDEGAMTNVKAHLTAIRKKIRPRGEEIVCEVVNNRLCYRHIVLLKSTIVGT